jgi:hypothetical protein
VVRLLLLAVLLPCLLCCSWDWRLHGLQCPANWLLLLLLQAMMTPRLMVSR